MLTMYTKSIDLSSPWLLQAETASPQSSAIHSNCSKFLYYQGLYQITWPTWPGLSVEASVVSSFLITRSSQSQSCAGYGTLSKVILQILWSLTRLHLLKYFISPCLSSYTYSSWTLSDLSLRKNHLHHKRPDQKQSMATIR